MTTPTLVRRRAAAVGRDPFDPTSLPWHALFMADDITGVVDGATFEQWDDSSGNARHATQATAGARPFYVAATATMKNRPTVLFNGGDFMQTVAWTSLSQPTTIVCIMQRTGTGNLVAFDGLTATERQYLFHSGSPYVIHAGTNLAAPAALSLDPHIHILTFNGASSSIIRDGETVATGDAGANALTGLTIAANYLGTGNMVGRYALIGVIDGTLTAQQVADLSGWAEDRYGVGTVPSPIAVSNVSTIAPEDAVNYPYLAFPSMTANASGDLVLVYREGVSHADDPTGRIVRRISTDDGATWGAGLVLADHVDDDERDPNIATLADGTILVNNCRVNSTNTALTGITVWRSTDGGTSFTQIFTTTEARATGGRIVERSDGSLLMPVYTSFGGGSSIIWRSTDNGETWSVLVTMTGTAVEPVLVEGLAAGEWLCFRRGGYMQRSADHGATWGAATQVIVTGNILVPGRSTAASQGLVVGIRGDGNRPAVTFSDDDGDTFASPIPLVDGLAANQEKADQVEISPGVWRMVFAANGVMRIATVSEV